MDGWIKEWLWIPRWIAVVCGQRTNQPQLAACFLSLPSPQTKAVKQKGPGNQRAAQQNQPPYHACGLALLGPWIDLETDRPLVEQHTTSLRLCFTIPPLLDNPPACLALHPYSGTLPTAGTWDDTLTHTCTNTTATNHHQPPPPPPANGTSCYHLLSLNPAHAC